MTNKPFFAARLEEAVNRRVEQVLRRVGWRESVIAFTGYGSDQQARVLARIVLVPAGATSPLGRATEELMQRRGWRNFFVAACVRARATVSVGQRRVEVTTDRGGYLDVRVSDHGLAPGWREATIETTEATARPAPLHIVDAATDFGIVSDIDDTVISTTLPRMLIAAWNTLVLTESARQAVPGMAQLYHALLKEHPGAPVIYLSTGAWNTAPMLERFLAHHGFPRGPLLLTDWGPTNAGWFRSGQAHKRTSLRELARDFPSIRWVLIGDDGQHDPSLYGEFAERMPDRVRVIGLRQLSAAEQVLAHGTPMAWLDEDASRNPAEVSEVRAPDGDSLLPLLRAQLVGRV